MARGQCCKRTPQAQHTVSVEPWGDVNSCDTKLNLALRVIVCAVRPSRTQSRDNCCFTSTCVLGSASPACARQPPPVFYQPVIHYIKHQQPWSVAVSGSCSQRCSLAEHRGLANRDSKLSKQVSKPLNICSVRVRTRSALACFTACSVLLLCLLARMTGSLQWSTS